MTETRSKLLAIINEHWRVHGYGPSVKELAAVTGTTRAAVHELLVKMVAEGALKGEPHKSRTWRAA